MVLKYVSDNTNNNNMDKMSTPLSESFLFGERVPVSRKFILSIVRLGPDELILETLLYSLILLSVRKIS